MSDATPSTNPPARNARCPCGSGKRYKDCHGAIAVDDRSGPPVAEASTQRRLDAALGAQQAGQLAEAIRLYETVVAEYPDTFDALHMMGVAHYQRGTLERAQHFVRSALRVMPHDRPARHNLQLIESALERRGVERDICRETLPRLAGRCIVAAGIDAATLRSASLDVVISRPDGPHIVERLAEFLHPASLTVWLYPDAPQVPVSGWPVRVIDPAAQIVPDRRHAVFVGADLSPADWYSCAAATDVSLYCDDEVACLLLDRIPELAREGATPLRLLFANEAHARRIGLPGTIVPTFARPS